ncbi:uncharacterized protein FIBRA_01971 [Fibroporia radiculosa]|uniref:FAD/NAD(P)-binding domain-containing protein n=1 Tax=Fibroporia radiculosa TaxID=599839 RepID=J4I8T0_9APHY|nr:uncharacterized protein FIBRA_01971 [Fibroporia radiculosa]CCL99946.1 predicted protein [Fibroporia radiculosa]
MAAEDVSSSPADAFEPALPTLDKLGAAIKPDLDAQAVARAWFQAFLQHVSSNDVAGVVSLFAEDGWWRDLLALTWDFRTFHGAAKIKAFLEDQLPVIKPTSFDLKSAELQQPYPDLVWLMGTFHFETEVGIGSGIFRLVPTSDGTWKGYTMFTNLEDLKGFPEKVGPLRNPLPNHGKWTSERERERSFADRDPTVLIIGGGQGGLTVAARLSYMGISALIVEQKDRIGDNWRDRYQALCLHDPVWYDHLPYLPFPSTWPVYTPAQKLAGWLEYYAEAIELNVWTSTTAVRVEQRDSKWAVTVRRKDGRERVLVVDHVVMCMGWQAGVPYIPEFPGREEFQGQVLHSTQHGSATNHAGKKVAVVGSATSAHDVASDYADHDVTLVQRNSTYIMSTTEGFRLGLGSLYHEGGVPADVADRLSSSMPIALQKETSKRLTAAIAAADKDLLQGLQKAGFKYNMGIDGSGLFHLVYLRGGGYYLDVGACQKIIDGEIKLKNDSQIERFTKTGLRFTNGSELDADVVLFATGFEKADSVLERLVGPEVASKMSPLWNLTPEGELRGVWRWLGVPNLWYTMGNLATCRFHSKHLALQIKAIKEGIYGKRYATSFTSTILDTTLVLSMMRDCGQMEPGALIATRLVTYRRKSTSTLATYDYHVEDAHAKVTKQADLGTPFLPRNFQVTW